MRAKLGSELLLGVRRANTLLFDAETGETLSRELSAAGSR